MKLEDTNDKLEEARLFLRYLDEAQNERKATIPFPYCLSAFLNAAYGVRQYLKAEFVRVRLEQARIQGKGLSEKEATQLYYQQVSKWRAALPKDKQKLWKSMGGFRNDEAHEKRVKTVATQKAVPSPYGTVEISNAFAAQYMMYQQVAAHYPEMAKTLAKEGMLFGTGTYTYIQENHLEIGGELHSTVGLCKDYYNLLPSLIAHFEPDGGQS